MRTGNIQVREVGQAFGCVGVVRDAESGRKLAQTRVYPHGFNGNASAGAERIALSKGWTVRAVYDE